jgi:hypothetical protein
MIEKLDSAIAALKLASECGGESDIPLYMEAYKGLVEVRSEVLRLELTMK